MPKLFPIHIEVEELAVGRVMRMLNGMPGVAKMHLDMEGQKKSHLNGGERGPYKPRKQPIISDETGTEVIAKVLFGKPPMTVAQLKQVFEAQGRSAKSISSVLYNMRDNGEVQSGEDGYSLTKKMRDRMRHRKVKK
jgi:hypothetical protein